ncbi:MAG: hypothetical protein MUF34_35555 [Polyangiaceae bacterium]|jgi:hypothetical protein|nr:hypothetical protein [Polyangiaceae bacterium]
MRLPTGSRARFVAGSFIPLFVAFYGCDVAEHRGASDAELGEQSSEVITSVIPSSKNCNYGIGPSKCLFAPPVTSVVASAYRWNVDGAFGPDEYRHATSIAYTSELLKANGKAYFQPVIGPTPVGGTEPQRMLHVYLQKIPLKGVVDGTPPTGGDAAVTLFVDHKRFTDTVSAPRPEDIAISLHLVTGAVQWQAGTSTGVFTPAAPPAGFAFTKGACAQEPSTVGTGKPVFLCDGELALPLPKDVFSPPEAGFSPGIGVALSSRSTNTGVLPEGLTSSNPSQSRKGWQTLLFDAPKGFPLSIMSWNLNRHDGQTLGGSFQDVSDQDVGTFLFNHDVVALQEGYDEDRVHKIFAAANQQRADHGLPAYKLYGPVQFSSSLLTELWAKVLGETVLQGETSTTGGLWIMTPLNKLEEDNLAFAEDSCNGEPCLETCRGEDCFKAKGVQWLRLSINPPTNQNTERKCETSPLGCPKAPSGDDYVDVFNTALQTTDPLLCDAENWSAVKGGLAAAAAAASAAGGPVGAVVGAFVAAVAAVGGLIENDLNCLTTTDAEVRTKQLKKLNSMVDKVASQKSDRPVLVLGTFAKDGRDLGATSYREILAGVEVGPGANPSTPPSDIISTFPADFEWDVDHGDLLRERTDVDFATGACTGTVIGEKDGSPAPACGFADKFDGAAREDFIFVRPPNPPDQSSGQPLPRWVVRRGKGEIWASPFPSIDGSFDGPPSRLSDHKPVVASIEYVPLDALPKYHAHWKHDVTLRVVSANATGVEDCALDWCAPVDLYTKLQGKRFLDATNFDQIAPWNKVTNECSDDYTVSFLNSCTSDWFVQSKHDPALHVRHSLAAELWDADGDPDSDDRFGFFSLPTPSGGTIPVLDDSPRVQMTWNAGGGQGLIELRGKKEPDNVIASAGEVKLPVFDSAPISVCSGSAPVSLCLQLEFTESPPGQQ